MKTLLVDIDNVLNNFTETVLNFYNKDYNTHFHMSDIYKYSMEETLGIPYKTLYKYFTNVELLNACQPLKDAQKYLKILNELTIMYIVTARDFRQLCDIDLWFERNYPFIKTEQIIRCRDKHLVQGDIRIDDHYDNLKYSKGGKILFNYPFNENLDLSDTMVYRVSSWEQCFRATMLLLGYNETTIEHYITGVDI